MLEGRESRGAAVGGVIKNQLQPNLFYFILLHVYFNSNLFSQTEKLASAIIM